MQKNVERWIAEETSVEVPADPQMSLVQGSGVPSTAPYDRPINHLQAVWLSNLADAIEDIRQLGRIRWFVHARPLSRLSLGQTFASP